MEKKKTNTRKTKKSNGSTTAKKGNVTSKPRKRQTRKKKTPEYKEFKENFENDKSIKGAGDVIEKVTKATGIDKAVKWIAGEDCGCDDRKVQANKKIRFSYKRQMLRCMTEEQFNWWTKYREKRIKASLLTQEEKNMYIEIGKQIFATDYTKDLNRGCSDCKKYLKNDIDRVYQQYL